MTTPTEFEWDEAKAKANVAKGRILFEDAVEVFADDDRIVFDTSRHADGEPRFKAVGAIDGRLYSVVFTMRGPSCRIISARPSNKQEVRRYDDRALPP